MISQRNTKSPPNYWPRFGKLAVEMGFITVEQLKKALDDQVDDDLANRPHRVLGTIFFEKMWMTPRQVDLVMDELVKRSKSS